MGLKQKQYVISGGAGFLGSHLTEKLLQEGSNVTVLDNLCTGVMENIKAFQANPNFRFIEHDITKPIDIDGPVDFVCNLASPASPPNYFKIPLETLETNSIGTRNMLELAKEKQARFFHTSTSEVYGDPTVHPQPETYFGNVESYCKRSCYDEGKRYAEALIYIYRHNYGVNTGIIRIFNTYGPRMLGFDGRVVSTFIRQALANQSITIQGGGQQTRSFCYVDDQVEGMNKMIHSDEEGPINIGNPGEFTILELAQKVIDLTHSRSKIIHIEAAPSDPKQRKPDIALAKQKLNWQPQVNLEQGLAKTITWFKQNSGAYA